MACAVDKKVEFHAALGRAIAAWQQVESALSRVFIRLLRCRGPETVPSAVFYTPISFSIQLSMTLNVAKLALSAANFRKFKKLRDKCDTESQFRNALVHFIVVYATGGPETEPFYLMPNAWNPAYKKPKAIPHAFTVKTINDTRLRFYRLATDLDQFSRKIPRRAMRQRAPARISPQPNRNQPRQNRNPKSHPTPPRSSRV